MAPVGQFPNNLFVQRFCKSICLSACSCWACEYKFHYSWNCFPHFEHWSIIMSLLLLNSSIAFLLNSLIETLFLTLTVFIGDVLRELLTNVLVCSFKLITFVFTSTCLLVCISCCSFCFLLSMVSLLLSATVERFSVSLMQDFVNCSFLSFLPIQGPLLEVKCISDALVNCYLHQPP